MDERKKLQDVLEKNHPAFRKHLQLDDSFLIDLVAEDVLTGPESEEIKGISIRRRIKRVDRLVEILKTRSFKTF